MIQKSLLNTQNIKEYNSNKKRKIFIVFDDTIANMLSKKSFIR